MAPLGEATLRKTSGSSEGSAGYGSEEGAEAPGSQRAFTNRSLNLARITCYGFDMDYTLCEYISPEFDRLASRLAVEWLVEERAYPSILLTLTYDPSFPVRGLWYDRLTGNLLKTDFMGKVLECRHGFRRLSSQQVRAVYPGGFQPKDDQRIFVMNTLFNLAETFLIAALTDFYNRLEGVVHTEAGWLLPSGAAFTFAQLFQDLRAAIDDIHLTSLLLKRAVIAEPGRYIRRDPRLPELLARIRRAGKQAFLLTNSDWWYTSHVMTFLLGPDWTAAFDVVGVDAGKPRFFGSGKELQAVATLEAGAPKVAVAAAPAGPRVYSGGSQAAYCALLGVRPEQVLYAGDHLWADVIRCRKQCAWRTILVVPELERELQVSERQAGLLEALEMVEQEMVEDGSKALEEGGRRRRVEALVGMVDQGFGGCGSLFRAGSRLSYFGSQVSLWSDVYMARVCDLFTYSLHHHFIPPLPRLPHEIIAAQSKSSSPEVEWEEEGVEGERKEEEVERRMVC